MQRQLLQVLTDICRHMEVMTTLSSHYHSQQQKQTQSHKAVADQQQAQPQPQPAQHPQHDHSTPQHADQQQQPGDSTTMLSDKGSRFDRPSLKEQQAGHLLRSVPARLAAAMSLVPHFCCRWGICVDTASFLTSVYLPDLPASTALCLHCV